MLQKKVEQKEGDRDEIGIAYEIKEEKNTFENDFKFKIIEVFIDQSEGEADFKLVGENLVMLNSKGVLKAWKLDFNNGLLEAKEGRQKAKSIRSFKIREMQNISLHSVPSNSHKMIKARRGIDGNV